MAAQTPTLGGVNSGWSLPLVTTHTHNSGRAVQCHYSNPTGLY